MTEADGRVKVLLLLIALFVLVSVVAYADLPGGRPDVALDSVEQRGLALWRRHGCQTCHQLHGFGGFLGPDLTNRVTERTNDEEIASFIFGGNGMMPSFRLANTDLEALVAFLRAMNRTGASQPPPLPAAHAIDPVRHFAAILDAQEAAGGPRPPEPARRGAQLWTTHCCGTCHTPFARGRNLAPDLSLRTVDRSPAALGPLLERARGRMPAFPLSGAEVADLSAFLEWVADRRAELIAVNDRLEGRAPFSWRTVPWWEYPR